MAIQCDNCGATYEGEWELNEIKTSRGGAGGPPGAGTKRVCPECDDPQGTFTEV